MVTFRVNIYGPLDRGRTTTAAGSFHTKKLCSRFYSMKLTFI